MKAVMLAAGVGARLEKGRDFKPKVLLEFGGQTLLRRHVAILRYLGFDELVMGVGHQAELIHDAIAEMGAGDFIRAVHNPIYEQGAITTLWALRGRVQVGCASHHDGCRRTLRLPDNGASGVVTAR